MSRSRWSPWPRLGEFAGPSPGRVTTTDVLIVGGGLLGCVTAYHLALMGVETLLVERAKVNREASGGNAGSLHFQIARQSDYGPSTLARLQSSAPLHAEAIKAWETIERDLDADLGVRRGGGLMVAETTAQLAALKQKRNLERRLGLDTELLSNSELLAVSPHLSPSLLGAVYCPDEGYANPSLVAPAYVRRATQAGATVVDDCDVVSMAVQSRSGFSVATSRGEIRARRVVNAAGASSASIASMVGLRLPVVGWAMHINVTEPWPILLGGQLIQHIGRRLTLKQTQYGTFIIGGGWPSHYDTGTKRKLTLWETFVGNIWVAARVMPILGSVEVIRTWGAMMGGSPDHGPIIGESGSVPGFFVVFPGDGGFTLGPVIGRLAAELVSSGKTSIPIEPFAIQRF
jgi:glycine/D-amino acid oxidase-like deaminating enzyme